MKKLCVLLVLCAGLTMLPSGEADAQIPILTIIKQAIKKVIIAIDLEVQRIQTNTVWLQNAQKVVENSMSQLHLNEITNWVQKQKDLYQQYFNELWQVKAIITDYDRVKSIAQEETALVNEYHQAWATLKQDKHFTVDELSYMGNVYDGILNATLQNAGQLLNVIDAFVTQMSDAKRMEVINHVGAAVDQNYSDLHQFNTQNGMLSLSRAKDENEAAEIRALYGLPPTP